MSAAFSDADLEVIAGAAFDADHDAAFERLREAFTTTTQLAKACGLADRVGRGEAQITFSTGRVVGLDLTESVREGVAVRVTE